MEKSKKDELTDDEIKALVDKQLREYWDDVVKRLSFWFKHKSKEALEDMYKGFALPLRPILIGKALTLRDKDRVIKMIKKETSKRLPTKHIGIRDVWTAIKKAKQYAKNNKKMKFKGGM